jgi:hypothetical protein
MWLKVKQNTETPEWHRNLSSIDEKSPEESTSSSLGRTNSFPFGEGLKEDETNDGFEIKNSKRKNLKDFDSR